MAPFLGSGVDVENPTRTVSLKEREVQQARFKGQLCGKDREESPLDMQVTSDLSPSMLLQHVKMSARAAVQPGGGREGVAF